jgi:hypothetical protein
MQRDVNPDDLMHKTALTLSELSAENIERYLLRLTVWVVWREFREGAKSPS